VAVSGGTRQAERGGRILDRQPGEVTQLDHPSGDGVLGSKPGEGCIQGEQLFVRNVGLGRDVGQLHPAAVAAVLVGLLPSGGIHQNAAHGFCRGGEEVSPAFPSRNVPRPDEPKVRFVNEGGRLQGLIGGLARHPSGGELAQLVVYEREQVGGGLAVTGRRGVQESRHVGHSANVTDTYESGRRQVAENYPLTHHGR
jgi:hypothetical protein